MCAASGTGFKEYFKVSLLLVYLLWRKSADFRISCSQPASCPPVGFTPGWPYGLVGTRCGAQLARVHPGPVHCPSLKPFFFANEHEQSHFPLCVRRFAYCSCTCSGWAGDGRWAGEAAGASSEHDEVV